MANEQPTAQPTPPTEVVSQAAPAASQPVVPVAAPAPVDTSPRNYLAVVVLAAFMGQYGLARWYRGDELGKIRFWIAGGLYGNDANHLPQCFVGAGDAYPVCLGHYRLLLANEHHSRCKRYAIRCNRARQDVGARA